MKVEDFYMVRKIDKKLIPLLLVLTEQVQGTKEMWIRNWNLYFSVMGFTEFAAITGYTVEQFKEAYEIFTQKVQKYYSNYKVEKGVSYSTFYAGIGLSGGIRFSFGVPTVVGDFEKFHDSMNWKYSHVSILNGAYFPMENRPLEFKPCEEVMRGLIIMYYENKEFFDRGADCPRYTYFPQVDLKAALESI